MGKRGPKSGDELKTEWSMICMQIMRNGGMNAVQAERFFEVGDGSGRTWRYWINGERLARSYIRAAITERAKAEGLLPPESIAVIKKMAVGADVSALPPLDVPEIPADADIPPWEAAFELWRWMRRRKIGRYLRSELRYAGLEAEYERRAEIVEQQIADRDLDDVTAMAWIRSAYEKITQSSRL